MGRFEGKL